MERDEFVYYGLIAATALMLGVVVVFTVMAFWTGEWRYLAATVAALIVLRSILWN